ncbi:MAG: response regulator [bacterium]
MTTILFVDDEEIIGRAVSRLFSIRGDTAFVAHSVSEAQLILTVHEPDIIFIDVWLGGESGFELLNWIEDHYPHLSDRVSFVSGDLPPDEEPNEVWQRLGRPVIRKPFDFSKLIEVVAGAGKGASA